MGAIKACIKIGVLYLVWGLYGCASPVQAYKKLDTKAKALADSILLYALDHEALYTILDTLKPMSSVYLLRYPLAADSMLIPGSVPALRNPAYIDTLRRYEQVCRVLSRGNLQWILVPFNRPDGSNRLIQLYVVQQNTLQQKIAAYPAFFGQYGLTPESDAGTLITLIEHAPAYNRWRGYGYLFGYPPHAVDFFVQAGKQQDSTGKFTERQFFHIPVYAATSGYFTYALDKHTPPGNADSLTYKKAMATLEKYKGFRHTWITPKRMRTKAILRSIYKQHASGWRGY